MFEIKEIYDEALKKKITKSVIFSLPEWFDEEGRNEYPNNLNTKPFFAVYNGEKAIGIVSLNVINKYTIEIYLLGILKEYHRMSIGKKLINKVMEYANERNFKIIMVKTLGESANYEFYNRTRMFYYKMGFYPLEEYIEIWNEENPCLIMVKPINN